MEIESKYMYTIQFVICLKRWLRTAQSHSNIMNEFEFLKSVLTATVNEPWSEGEIKFSQRWRLRSAIVEPMNWLVRFYLLSHYATTFTPFSLCEELDISFRFGGEKVVITANKSFAASRIFINFFIGLIQSASFPIFSLNFHSLFSSLDE